MNPMKEIFVEKVTLNIGAGGPGENLDKAVKLLEAITGGKCLRTRTMERIPGWGLRPRLPVAAKVTLRGKKAEEILKRLLEAVDFRINQRKFDRTGNFSFGVDEYIRIPGVEYDVSIGIIGLEAAVTLTRRGYRVKKRAYKTAKVGKKHTIARDEAMDFVKQKFGVEILTGKNEEEQ
ncbi:MAG: 50S ribosomal protein L5 [Candidatus Woesearchaeota archaeon]